MLEGKKRYIIPAVLLLLGGAYVVVNHVTSASFVTPRIEKHLSRKLEAKVEVRDVNFGLIRGTTIGGLTISPDSSTKSVPAVQISELGVRHRLGHLLLGDYQVKSMTVGQLDADLASSELAWLERVREKARRKPEPIDVADTTVRNGTVTVTGGKGRTPISVSGLNLKTRQDKPGGEVTGEGHFSVGADTVQFDFVSHPERKRARTRVSFRDVGLENVPLKAVLGPDSAARDIDISGTAEGHISLRKADRTEDAPHVSGAVSFSDVAVSYRPWNAQANHISGRMELTSSMLDVQRLNGDFAGGNFSISGLNLEFDDGTCDSFSMAGRATDLEAVRLPLQALPPDLRTKTDKADLQAGKVGASYSLRWRRGQGTTWKTDVAARGVSFTVPELDVPATGANIEATVASDGHATIHGAGARVYGGRVDLSGALGWSEDGPEMHELEIELTDIPAAEELVTKIPSPVPEIRAAIRPTEARCSGTVRVGDGENEVDLRVVARRLRPRGFSYPLREASFGIRWSSSREEVRIPDMEARHGSGLLHGRGTVDYGEETKLTLAVGGDYLPVDEHLTSLLPQSARERWARWEAQGYFDFRFRMLDQSLEDLAVESVLQNTTADITVHNLSVRQPGQSPVTRGLEGHLVLGRDGVNMTRMRGEVFGIGMGMDGHLEIGEQTALEVRFRSDRTRITSRLKERCPDWMGSVLNEFNAGGQFEVHGTLSYPAKGAEAPSLALDLPFYDLEANGGDAPIRGSGRLHLGFPTLTKSSQDFEGHLRFDSLQISGLQVERGAVSLERRGEKLAIKDGRFAVCNGTVHVSEASISLEDRSWNVAAQLSYLEIESLLLALGMEGRLPSGVLQGEISLQGTGLSANTLSGRGELRASRGRLYDLPIMLSVFNVLDLRLPRGEPISRAYGSFRIEEEKLRIEDLILAGGAVPVYVSGHIGLSQEKSLGQQDLNLLFSAVNRTGPLDTVPVVNWVKRLTVDQIRKYVLQARVKGTVEDYDIAGLASPVSAPITAFWSLLDKVAPPEPGAAPAASDAPR